MHLVEALIRGLGLLDTNLNLNLRAARCNPEYLNSFHYLTLWADMISTTVPTGGTRPGAILGLHRYMASSLRRGSLMAGFL